MITAMSTSTHFLEAVATPVVLRTQLLLEHSQLARVLLARLLHSLLALYMNTLSITSHSDVT